MLPVEFPFLFKFRQAATLMNILENRIANHVSMINMRPIGRKSEEDPSALNFT